MVASLLRELERVEVVAQALADLARDVPACATMPSALPYSLSHFAAVFGPTFGTPGMLSELSPTSAR